MVKIVQNKITSGEKMLVDPSIGPNTISYLSQIALTSNVEGDIVECGVYNGHNLYYYCKFAKLLKLNKTIYGLDTFSGFPSEYIEPETKGHFFTDTSISSVSNLLKNFNNFKLLQGKFDETFQDSNLKDKKFSCVILDCDLETSYKQCLDFFYDKLNIGGIIVFDEYFSDKYPNTKYVIEEFFFNKKEKPHIFQVELNGWQRWRIVKE
jgi:O-methyltransferase